MDTTDKETAATSGFLKLLIKTPPTRQRLLQTRQRGVIAPADCRDYATLRIIVVVIGSVPLNCGESMEFSKILDQMTALRLTASRGVIGEGAGRRLRSLDSG